MKQHFDRLIKSIFNPFHGTGVFLYFQKYIRKPEVPGSFQGGIEGDQLYEMG